jgi:SAM-dependent methyltransferase
MDIEFHPASFKDPEGRVFRYGDSYYRTLSVEARLRMERLSADGVLAQFIDAKLLLPCKLLKSKDAGLDPDIVGEAVLHHETIPFISYPYEWSFCMLKDAAIVTLNLMTACLDQDLILKDATSHNVTLWRGHMLPFDTLSIDDYKIGQPWDGYAQFTREFLFPLLLNAHRGIDFQPLLRSSLSGIDLNTVNAIFSTLDYFRSGVFFHVKLQAFLTNAQSNKDASIRKDFTDSIFSKEAIKRLVSGLRRIISGLRYSPRQSTWIGYESCLPYSENAISQKSNIVTNFFQQKADGITVLDLGCNTGRYSRLASDKAQRLIAMDADPVCVDSFYQEMKSNEISKYYTIVCDLFNPSPSMGWELTEKLSIFDRIKADSFLALGLVHHICIGGNVPIPRLMSVLSNLADNGLIEWIDKSDPMVQAILRNRVDVFDDYNWDNFYSCLSDCYQTIKVHELDGGTRRICEVA